MALNCHHAVVQQTGGQHGGRQTALGESVRHHRGGGDGGAVRSSKGWSGQRHARQNSFGGEPHRCRLSRWPTRWDVATAPEQQHAYRINLPRNGASHHVLRCGHQSQAVGWAVPRHSPGHDNKRNAHDGRPRDAREVAGSPCVAGMVSLNRTAQASAAARPASVVDPPHSQTWW